jgi:hypothetical protein
MNHIETLLIDQEPDQVGPLTSMPSKKRRLNSRTARADVPSHSQVMSPEILRRCEAGPCRSLASEHHHEAALTRLSQLNSPVRDVTSPGPSFGSGSVLSLTSAGLGKVRKLIIDLRKPRPCGRSHVQFIEEWNGKLLNNNQEQEDWWFGCQKIDDSCHAPELLQLASFVKTWDKEHNARRFIMLRHIATMVDMEMVSRQEAIHQTTLAQNQTCRSTAINEIYNTLKLTAPSESSNIFITRDEFRKLVIQAEKWKRLNPGFVFCFVERWASRLLSPPC